ncbi:nucleotide exchange factor GrpE [Vibrio cholerae]|nr:nucleotide exchange factor GrpE [Vibrio cholerae]
MKDQETNRPICKDSALNESTGEGSRSDDLLEYEKKCTEYEDKLLRLRADMDNLAKRSAREVEKARKYAVSQLLESLLPVKDSLELGLESGREDTPVERILEGVTLTLEQLDTVLKTFGVRTIDPLGQAFNPEHHEAMRVVSCSDVPPNTVCEVHQKGYLLHDRVIRPARVGVSKSPDPRSINAKSR